MTTRRHFVQTLGSAAALGALASAFARSRRGARTRSRSSTASRPAAPATAWRAAWPRSWAARLHQERRGGREQARRRRPHRARDAQGRAGRRLGAGAGAGLGARRPTRTSTPSSATSAEDFAPVSIGAVMTTAWRSARRCRPSVKTLKDFLAWAKANPEQASYGSPGAGSTPHFLGALLGLRQRRGAQARALPRLAARQSPTWWAARSPPRMTPARRLPALPKAGKLRVLATSGKQRSPYLPDVPTFAEQGFPGRDVRGMVRLLRPGQDAGRHHRQRQCRDQRRAEGQGGDRRLLALVGLVANGSHAGRKWQPTRRPSTSAGDRWSSRSALPLSRNHREFDMRLSIVSARVRRHRPLRPVEFPNRNRRHS